MLFTDFRKKILTSGPEDFENPQGFGTDNFPSDTGSPLVLYQFSIDLIQYRQFFRC